MDKYLYCTYISVDKRLLFLKSISQMLVVWNELYPACEQVKFKKLNALSYLELNSNGDEKRPSEEH